MNGAIQINLPLKWEKEMGKGGASKHNAVTKRVQFEMKTDETQEQKKKKKRL